MGYALFKIPGPRSEWPRCKQRGIAADVAEVAGKHARRKFDFGVAYRKFIYLDGVNDDTDIAAVKKTAAHMELAYKIVK